MTRIVEKTILYCLVKHSTENVTLTRIYINIISECTPRGTKSNLRLGSNLTASLQLIRC